MPTMRGFRSLLEEELLEEDDNVVVPVHRPQHRDAQKLRLQVGYKP